MPKIALVPEASRTCCARRQPRRKPSRLRNKIVVLIRWNCTDASCTHPCYIKASTYHMEEDMQFTR